MSDDPGHAEPVQVQPHDPVRATRRRIARWARIATRTGYACYGASSVAVVWGATRGFGAAASAVGTAGLVAGSVLLAPAIVVTYAVRAAEKEDRAAGL